LGAQPKEEDAPRKEKIKALDRKVDEATMDRYSLGKAQATPCQKCGSGVKALT
jgi:hypothetical protein